MSIRISTFLLTAIFAVSSLPAQAATMTFDNLIDPYDFTDSYDTYARSYTENDITVTGNVGIYGAGSIIIADGGQNDWLFPAPTRIIFTTANPFNATSFDILRSAFYYFVCDEAGACTYTTYVNLVVEGFFNNSFVASLSLDTSKVRASRTVTLGSAFSNLTSLAISARLPLVDPEICGSDCSHFEIDNVTLTAVTPAPVPLPAGLPLAVSGLALLGGLALRRRSRR